MKKALILTLTIIFMFACEKTPQRPIGVSDLVTGELIFTIHHLPCDDLMNPNCDPMPIFDATVRLWKLEDGGNERNFVGEKKTNREGQLNFPFVPLGIFEAVVSTIHGDKRIPVESIANIPSEVQVQFP